MIYQLTIKHEDGHVEYRTAIGAIKAICDELYDAGALGVTAMVRS